MKYCSKCGKQNPDEAQFCAECGNPFPAKVIQQGKSGGKGIIIAIVLSALIIGGVVVLVNINKSQQQNVDVYRPTTSTTTYSNNYTYQEPSIDKQRVEKILTAISQCSSKGGDYYSLRNYFTDEIWPHPSAEKRYNTNIAEKTKAYVERFPKYEVSDPYNFSYHNSTFPLIVTCDVMVNWINTKGTAKKAIVHKTYYITSYYKVSGFNEIQQNL